MNFGFHLLLLTTLLYTECLAKYPLQDDVIQSSNGGSYQDRSIEKCRGGLKFQEINTDVLSLIFELVDLMDLMTMINVNQVYYPLAVRAFRRNYKNYTVDFWHIHHDRNHALDDIREDFNVKTSERRVNVFDLDVFTNLFTLFGAEIEKVKIRNVNFNNDTSSRASQIINEYGSESIDHLDLGVIKENTLEMFSRPFKAVKTLVLTIENKKYSNGPLAFSQLFPHISKLKLIVYSVKNYEFLHQNLPELETLHLFASESSRYKSSQIDGILKKNPQIREFYLTNVPDNYAEVINRLLPNLERLILQNLDVESDPVHFERVKYFNLLDSPGALDKLSFASLESVKMAIYYAEDFGSWSQFFRRHQNVTSLHLIENIKRGTMELATLTASLANLVEVELECARRFNLEAIYDFIETHEKLTKFQFSIRLFKKEHQQALRDRYQHEWHIEEFDGRWKGLSFERKQM